MRNISRLCIYLAKIGGNRLNFAEHFVLDSSKAVWIVCVEHPMPSVATKMNYVRALDGRFKTCQKSMPRLIFRRSKDSAVQATGKRKMQRLQYDQLEALSDQEVDHAKWDNM